MEWMICFAGFLGLELFCGCLVSMWFAAGALAAFGAQRLGAGLELQLWVFTAVSFLILFLIRPLSFLLGRRRGRERKQ